MVYLHVDTKLVKVSQYNTQLQVDGAHGNRSHFNATLLERFDRGRLETAANKPMHNLHKG